MHQIVNGSHFSDADGYFEWWYFHFASTGGFTGNIVLHETDIFGLRKKPYVSMSYENAGEIRYLRSSVPSGSIERNTRLLTQSEGLFQESGETIDIHLDFPTGEVFSVTIHKNSHPVVINDCLLYQNEGRASFWILQLPLGYFQGSLVANKQMILLEGVIYHDHQWGTLPLQDFVSDWAWGHRIGQLHTFTFEHPIAK